MKKRLLSIVMILAVLPLCFLFTGCTYKKYTFFGIIAQDNTTIIPYSEITDEETKEDLSVYVDSTIELRRDGTSTRTIKTVSTTQVDTYYLFVENGRYELDDKSLVFIVTLENGKEHKNQQQFVDGKIIYYDSEYLLVYV